MARRVDLSPLGLPVRKKTFIAKTALAFAVTKVFKFTLRSITRIFGLEEKTTVFQLDSKTKDFKL